MEDKELLELAFKAKEKAYAPYSKFRVGAALVTQSGKVYTGCNIENASFGATVCAERTALFKAVSDGENKITAIAIASDSEDYIYPCGICRQVLSEFASSDLKIICSKPDGEYVAVTMDGILPNAIKKDDVLK